MDKNKFVTALKFDPETNVAPQVIAKGMGMVAENIIKVAEENNVPVYRDEKLANQLKNLEIGETIPTELYEVVAEVLVFISDIDMRKK